MKKTPILLMCLLFSCGSNDKVCDPGSQTECICPDEKQSTQDCLPDGNGWDECDCECMRNCTDKVCGDDGCGGSCGDCQVNENCIDGQCECLYVSCSTDCCDIGETCSNGICCSPDCSEKECGPDGCGGECPPGCDAGESCNLEGICVGSIVRNWVTITSGSFTMGSPENEIGRKCCNYEYERQHEVILENDFVILSTEVTQGDFEDVMGYNPSNWGQDGLVYCGRDCPVETVNWHKAAAFCNEISSNEGYDLCYTCTGPLETPICEPNSSYPTPYDCPGYRLPTEAEWEYAARANTTEATYNGNLEENLLVCDDINPVLDPIAWFCGNSNSMTHPVALKEPNDWGLYDTIGNVYEWCYDWYQHELSESSVTNPWGPDSGTHRVFRGGSIYGLDSSECRSAFRNGFPPYIGGSEQGFRPARTLH